MCKQASHAITSQSTGVAETREREEEGLCAIMIEEVCEGISADNLTRLFSVGANSTDILRQSEI
jgi:hypothetical protein